MKNRQFACGIVAVLLGMLALLPFPERTRAEAPGALSVLSAAEDSGGVLVTLDVASVDTNVTGDWYLEFEFDPPETDEVLRIEAWLVTTEAGPTESALPSEPISVWEITPADRAVGLGGYVRLYLPPPALSVGTDLGTLQVRIRSSTVPAFTLRVALNARPNRVDEQDQGE